MDSGPPPAQGIQLQGQMQPQASLPRTQAPSVFIPRSHRNNPVGVRGAATRANLAQSSTRQLLDSHAQLQHVLQTTAVHLPASSRAKLERDAQLLQREIQLRSAQTAGAGSADKGKGKAAMFGQDEEREVNGWILVGGQQQQQQQQQQHEGQSVNSQVDQLRGAIAQLDIDQPGAGQIKKEVFANPATDPGPSDGAATKNMTFRQMLTQGIVNAGSPNIGIASTLGAPNPRRPSGQGPIVLLEPCSSALAEAEALQAADHLRAIDEAEQQRARRRTAAQQKRSGKAKAGDGQGSTSSHSMRLRPRKRPAEGSSSASTNTSTAMDLADSADANHPSWSFYTPDGLFGDDDDDDANDDDDDEDDDDGASRTGRSTMESSLISSGQMSISQSTSSTLHFELEPRRTSTAQPHRKVRRRLSGQGDGQYEVTEDDDEDDEMIPDISASEQHAIEAAQEAEAMLDSEQPARWAFEAVAAREASERPGRGR
ncbi:hypothetical protein OC842_004625 [Tilletia horrida]|uniref:Uncharacterized protein n=1 Tax=Tilletia horrida TaxID=155126 RepID=A0AAN6GDZ0_9BASI|nr:hypothetical protein OC842_004625 [Tilletia horrida]